MIYGYARVSTRGQAKAGNSLEVQEKQLKQAGAEKIYKDAFTGTKTDRPELDKLIKKLQPGDTIIITKLDRIARSVSKGSELIQELLSRDITVHVLNIGIMDSTPTGKLLYTVMLAFAEFERDMIVERTQEGRRESGNFGGRPRKYSRVQMEHAIDLLENKSYTQVAEMTGISKATLARAKKEYNNQTGIINF